MVVSGLSSYPALRRWLTGQLACRLSYEGLGDGDRTDRQSAAQARGPDGLPHAFEGP
jgi:hypothetical protein